MTDQRRDLEQRPSPEALLAQAQREEGATGKLKIFIGAAPGVGKTYKMLEEARVKRKDGVDVVVGVAETHGRARSRAASGASPTTSSPFRKPTTSPRSSSANRAAPAGSKSCMARWCTSWCGAAATSAFM
jgi:hypothetical protein